MLTLLLAALVAISAMGREASHPAVFFLYRSLVFAIVIKCVRDLQRNRSLSISPAFAGAAALASILMLSFLRNASTAEGFYFWYEFVLFGVMFVVLASNARHQSPEWKRRLLWIVAAIQAAYVLGALLLKARPITAGFVNPNYFASFLLVGLSICLAMALFQSSKPQRFYGFAGALLFYYGITQAWSRGAAIAAVLITIIALARYARRIQVSRATIAVVAGALITAGAIASPQLVRKFTDRGRIDPYNYMRPRIWMGTMRLIADHTFLGVGVGQFVHVSRRYASPMAGAVGRYVTRPGIAHSEYLQYAAETGLPAALLIIALAGYLVWLAIRRARTCAAELRPVQESALLAAVALMGHALVDNNWTVAAMAAGLTVFALADVLPYSDRSFEIRWTPRRQLAAVAAVLFLYVHSTLIPSTGFLFNELGARAFNAGDLKAAEAHYRLSAAVLPAHVTVLDNAGSFWVARYRKLHDNDSLARAEEFFQRAMDANPSAEAPLRHMEGVLIERLSGDAAADLPIHRRIAEIDRRLLMVDPFNPFARKNLAEALYTIGERRQAEQELARAVELEPNYVPGYLTLARWKTEQGEGKLGDQYRSYALAIVAKNASVKTDERYEALLLGRPDPVQKRNGAEW